MPPAKRNGGPPKRTFREFQFIVTPVLLVEEEGQVPYPQQGEQFVLRGVRELKAFIDRFEYDLAGLNAEAARAGGEQ